MSLSHRSHYEVHGDSDQSQPPASRALHTAGVPFAFMRQPSFSASTDTPGASPGTPLSGGLFPARSFQRLLVNYATHLCC